MIERIYAMLLRHLYIYRRSMVRVFEVFFWPIMDLLVWGFVTVYLSKVGAPSIVVFLLGGMILWDIFFRAQQAVSLSILQEMWVGNLLNIFVSPIRTWEFVVSSCLLGILRACATALVLSILATLWYSFNILSLGSTLFVGFFLLLFFGWSMGIFATALILRFGQAAEALAWAVPFPVQPFSAVFYPVSALPGGLRELCYAFPTTYVFEAMRGALAGQAFSWDYMLIALLLCGVYTILSSFYLSSVLNTLRERGSLARSNRET